MREAVGQPVFDTRVRPPFGSFAQVRMAARVDPVDYTSRRLEVPGSIADGPDYDRFLGEVEEAGVTTMLVAGRTGTALGAAPDNSDVHALVHSDPVRYRGAIAMSSDDPLASVDELNRSVRPGMVGVTVEPGFAAVPRRLDDPFLDPIWEACQALDLPALVMCGGICGPDLSWSDPVALDRLAARWPEVKFVAVKGGHPYVLEMLSVAFRRPNVWVSPDLWMCNMPGAQHYVEAVNTFLADRFLYASAYPLVALDQSLELWRGLPFERDLLPRILHDNAQRLFGA